MPKLAAASPGTDRFVAPVLLRLPDLEAIALRASAAQSAAAAERSPRSEAIYSMSDHRAEPLKEPTESKLPVPDPPPLQAAGQPVPAPPPTPPTAPVVKTASQPVGPTMTARLVQFATSRTALALALVAILGWALLRPGDGESSEANDFPIPPFDASVSISGPAAGGAISKDTSAPTASAPSPAQRIATLGAPTSPRLTDVSSDGPTGSVASVPIQPPPFDSPSSVAAVKIRQPPTGAGEPRTASDRLTPAPTPSQPIAVTSPAPAPAPPKPPAPADSQLVRRTRTPQPIVDWSRYLPGGPEGAAPLQSLATNSTKADPTGTLPYPATDQPVAPSFDPLGAGPSGLSDGSGSVAPKPSAAEQSPTPRVAMPELPSRW